MRQRRRRRIRSGWKRRSKEAWPGSCAETVGGRGCAADAVATVFCAANSFQRRERCLFFHQLDQLIQNWFIGTMCFGGRRSEQWGVPPWHRRGRTIVLFGNVVLAGMALPVMICCSNLWIDHCAHTCVGASCYPPRDGLQEDAGTITDGVYL